MASEIEEIFSDNNKHCKYCDIIIHEKDDMVECFGECKGVFHLGCSKLARGIYKNLKENKNMKFVCDNCLLCNNSKCVSFKQEMKNILSTVAEQLEEINVVKENIENVSGVVKNLIQVELNTVVADNLRQIWCASKEKDLEEMRKCIAEIVKDDIKKLVQNEITAIVRENFSASVNVNASTSGLSSNKQKRVHGNEESAKNIDAEMKDVQVYKGLDIVTAKANKEEQSQAKHHLLDVATPEQAFTVMHFREAAIPIIDDLLNCHKKMPIVVGGTNYYIESVVWKVLVGQSVKNDNLRRKSIESSDDDDREEEDDDDKTINITKKSKLDADYKDSPAASTSSSSKQKEKNQKTFELENESKLSEIKSELDVDNLLKMTVKELENQPSTTLHNYLKIVDPVSANRLHPNNKRKIVRALEVFIDNEGQTLTSFLEKQRRAPGGCNLGGPLRYADVVIFWLRCDQEILNARLDARVDAMVAQGLLKEIRHFHDNYVKPYQNSDYHKGILQSIGFKEFIVYLEKFDESHDELITKYSKIPSGDEPEGLATLKTCLDALKLVTRRYSKRQLKWINHRFLGNKSREVPDLYALDTSDVANWKESVFEKAEKVVQSVIEGTTCDVLPLEKLKNPREGLNEEVTNFCADCNKTIIGEYQWNIHMKSNKHKKCVARKFKNKEK